MKTAVITTGGLGTREATITKTIPKTMLPLYTKSNYDSDPLLKPLIEIIFDKNKTNYGDLLDHFWINIDPFDAYGQFCDKGYSYRSVAFYQNDKQKDLIENSVMKLSLIHI